MLYYFILIITLAILQTKRLDLHHGDNTEQTRWKHMKYSNQQRNDKADRHSSEYTEYSSSSEYAEESSSSSSTSTSSDGTTTTTTVTSKTTPTGTVTTKTTTTTTPKTATSPATTTTTKVTTTTGDPDHTVELITKPTSNTTTTTKPTTPTKPTPNTTTTPAKPTTTTTPTTPTTTPTKPTPPSDKVTTKLSQLPPYNHSWYAGYLNNNTFYTFFESQSNPDKDPLVLWLQGGPGCSSLFGLFYEVGPFRFDALSNYTHINNQSWNLQSNLLFIEMPNGVGYSTPSKLSNDNDATSDALLALLDFFKKYPKLVGRPFYLSGESYAGMYIPFLATAILKQKSINLKGFLLGNGCTLGTECTDYSSMPFWYSRYEFEQFINHAFCSLEMREEFNTKCQDFTSSECMKVQSKLLSLINFKRVDINNINGYCYHNDPSLQYLNGGQNKNRHQPKGRKMHFSTQEAPCNYEVGEYYFFNNATVTKALHANPTKWSSCSNNLKFKEDPRGSFGLYADLIKANLKIWIYSGDVDSNVPITGTLKWIQDLKLKETDPWRVWYTQGNRENEQQVGGMTWGFGNVRFVSIRGAGHEVPFWKPEAATVLFDGFIQNTL